MDYLTDFIRSNSREIIVLATLAFVSYWFGHFKGYWKGFCYARACRNCPRFRECPECGSIASPLHPEKHQKKAG
jgi:hypothetical protein